MLRFFLFAFAFVLFSFSAFAGQRNDALKNKAAQLLQNNSIQFTENNGQLKDMNGRPVPFVLFKASAPGTDVYITEKGLSYVFLKSESDNNSHHEKRDVPVSARDKKEAQQVEWARLDMDLKDALIRKENVIREDGSEAELNFYYAHCPDGIRDVHEYRKITIKNIYPEIDWVLHLSGDKGFKYDFIVHPGADPAQIKLLYRSEKKLNLDRDGNIFLKTPCGTLTENAPVSFIRETQQNIPTSFIKKNVISTAQPKGYETDISFSLTSNIPPSSTLVIDPQIVWATFYGGTNGYGGPLSADCDANGNLFVSGYLIATDMPVQSAGTFFQGTIGGSMDIFILKFNNAGVRQWATYYGGGTTEVGNSIACDKNTPSNVYVTGWTWGGGFPLQNLPGAYNNAVFTGVADAFILKFDNAGNRLWATFFDQSDQGNSVFCDNNNNLYLGGMTWSNTFPLLNAAQPVFGGGSYDAYAVKFSPAGVIQWATYHGGTGDEYGYAITSDNNTPANVYMTGYTTSSDMPVSNAAQATSGGGVADAFVIKYNSAGATQWSTYYGGSSDEQGHSICCDRNNIVYVLGYTTSANFPCVNPGGGAWFVNTLAGTTFPKADAFFLEFANAGTCTWATYYGGNDYDSNESDNTWDNLQFDGCGNMYASFNTRSSDLPTVNPGCGFFDGTLDGGKGFRDVYILKFNSSKVPTWATYFGGSGADFRGALAVDANNNLFCVGEWAYASSVGMNLPLTDPGGGAFYVATPPGGEVPFVSKFSPEPLTLAMSAAGTCSCTGTATATATSCASPFSYLWNTIPAQTTQSATGLCAGNYSVSVTNSDCVNRTNTVTVSASGSFTTSIAGNTTICAGNSATLTASGGSTYSWNNGQTTTSIIVTPTGNTTYTLTAFNAPCSHDTSITVIVNPQPNATISGSATICSGQAATLTASGGGNYSWSNGLTNSVITVNPSANTSYSVIVSNAGGCTDTATILVTASPNMNPAVSPSTICAGDSSLLSANGGGTYSWNTGASASSIYVSPTTTTSYTVTVTNGVCTGTAVATVNVSNTIVAVISGQISLCAGKSSTLTGSGGSSYSWNTGQTNSSIVVTPTGNTSYTLTAFSSSCSHDTSVTVIVSPMPVAAISGSTTICNGQTATLAASGGGNYLWNTGSTNSAITVSPTNNTTYSVIVSNAGGCTDTASVLVTTSPNINPTVSPSTICFGGTAVLSASGGGSYQWNTGATTSAITVSPTVTTSYTVTVVNGVCTASAVATVNVANSITALVNGQTLVCAGGSTTLTASGGSSFSWSSGQTTASIIISPTGNTSYTVTATSGSCTDDAVIAVTIKPLPAPSISGNTTICPGQSATISASGGNTYSWNPGGQTTSSLLISPTTTTSYTVTATSANGCTNSTSLQVTVNNAPAVSISGNTVLCSGDAATLTASGGITYVWNTAATSSVITVSPTINTNYTVAIINSSGCTGTASVAVTVSPPPTASIAGNNTICAGNNTVLTASGGGNYLWSNGQTTSSINVSPAASTSYSVTVTVGNCKDSAFYSVAVTPVPVASAGVNVSLYSGQSTTLTATGGGNYSWSNGMTSQSIVVTPTATTQYCVYITDANGCTDSSCVIASVMPLDCSVYGDVFVPNAFSPNGDDENDVFRIFYGSFDCIEEFKITIYSRWGEKIFESTNANFSWDGSYNNEVMNSAVFAWYLSLEYKNSKNAELKGNVSLVR